MKITCANASLRLTPEMMNDPSKLDLGSFRRKRMEEEDERIAEEERLRHIEEMKAEHADFFNKLTGVPDKDIVTVFEEFVPASGKSDTVGGEIARAVNRIGYRYNNDGDIFFLGYGIETCGAPASYLMQFDEIGDCLLDFAKSHKNTGSVDAIEADYDNFLDQLYAVTMDYLNEHPDLYFEANDDDMHKFPEEDWKKYEPVDSLYIEIPGAVITYMEDYEFFDLGEIETDAEDIARQYGVSSRDVSVGRYYIEIEDIPITELEELERELYSMLENWEREGDDRYDEYEEEQEDEEEDY